MTVYLLRRLIQAVGVVLAMSLLAGITYAGMASIAFTIVGSAFLILSILPDVFPFLTGLFAATFDKMTDLYMIGFNASVSTISI